MTSPITIGVLGCSVFAQRSMLPTLQAMPDLYQLVGVASRNAEKAAACAAPLATTPYASYEALLDHPGLRAVYIPLPNGLHAEWIDRALDRNLHVLVEKSLACNATDAQALCRKAGEKKLALVENFQFRFHRQLAVIKELIAAEVLGELRCVRCSFGFPPFPDPGNIRYQAALGGGALLDAGAYMMKISQEILGPDIEVAAASMRYDRARDIDVWGGGFLRQRQGPLFSEIAFGFDHHYQCSLELWGSNARLFTNRIFTAPPGYQAQLIIEDKNGTRTIQVEPDNHYANMLRHFHALVMHPGSADEELRQNIRQAELLDQFRNIAHVH
jgi:NDP-hexose-3-ketoreductase